MLSTLSTRRPVPVGSRYVLEVEGWRLSTLGDFFRQFGVFQIRRDCVLPMYGAATPATFLDLDSLAAALGYEATIDHHSKIIYWARPALPIGAWLP